MERLADMFRGLDRLVRSEDEAAATDPMEPRRLVTAIALLGAAYGVCMGLYAALRGTDRTIWQIPASAAKVPALFLLTLLVTFPSLYVLAALARSSLRFRQTLHLLLRALAVSLLLLASFGPITAFFTLSTKSYPFIVLLNVLMLSVSGAAGIVFLRRMVNGLFSGESWRDTARSDRILKIWIYIYAVVGAQMAWILRPFIGSPGLPFALFRDRESNFFRGVVEAIRALF